MSATASAAVPQPRAPRWPLIVVLVIAFAIRLFEARGVKLWFDEIYIVMVGRLGFADILHTAAADIHPPLHFLVRRLWQLAGGEGDRWLKLLSIGFSLVGIGFTEALGRRAISPRAGLLAAALCALCPAHVHLSQIVDVYPMLWALTSVAAWAAWRAVAERSQPHTWTLAIVSIAALYTHYLSIAILGAIALWGMVVLARDRRALPGWIGLWVVVAIAFIPQSIVLAHQFAMEGHGSFFTFPNHQGIHDLWRQISFGSHLLMPLLLLAVIAAAILSPRRRAVWLLLPLLVLPIPCTRWWALVITRDMLVVIPFVYLLVGAAIDRLPGRLVPALAALALVALAAREYSHHTRFAEPLALARAQDVLDQLAGRDDLILHAETHSLLYFRYYEPARRHLLLAEPGFHVPYFDAGLVVPDSWLTTPEAWAAARDSGIAWWGVRVDRAFTTRGHTTRAGARDAAEFDSLAITRKWPLTPVTVWRGTPLRPGSTLPATR